VLAASAFNQQGQYANSPSNTHRFFPSRSRNRRDGERLIFMKNEYIGSAGPYWNNGHEHLGVGR